MTIKQFPKKGQYIRTPEMRALASQRAKGNVHAKGRIITPELREKLRLSNLGKKHRFSPHLSRRGKPTWNAGKGIIYPYICAQCNLASTTSQRNRKFCSIRCYRIFNHGENNYRWIKDRTKIIGRHNRNIHDPCIKQWRKLVWMRDNWTCQLKNKDCSGRLEAHHILRWKSYPQLRYELNNGITLCHFHHPRTQKSEDSLVSLFQKLIDSHRL